MNTEIITHNYHFIRPEYLYLLTLLPFIYIVKKSFSYFKNSKKNQVFNTRDNWMDVCRPEILNNLYISNKNNKSNRTHLLLLFTSIIMILALAGPTRSKHDIPLYKSRSSWVIVLSLADSMQNTDVTPTRLQRAKYKIQDFLNLLTDEQLALIIYTNSAFNLIPLTSDKKTIDHILPSIDPLIMPIAGDNINAPLEKILNLRQTLKLKNLNVLILTDSNANSQSLLTAKKFDNIHINIINFNKTRNNNFNNSLRELSTISNGLYQDVSNNDDDIKNILQSANTNYQLTQEYEQEKNNPHTEVWHDIGPYLLFLILPFILFFLIKSGYNLQSLIAFTLINTIALSIPNNRTYAASPSFLNKLWYSEQQLAAEQLKQSNIVKTVKPEVFKSPTWQAAAFYKNKNYNKSTELLQNRSDVTSLYNYANSLAQQGNITEAIENYKKVLQANPNHSDAKFNKNLLEKYQKDKYQQNQNQNNQQKQDQNKNSNPDQQDKQDQQSQPNNQKTDLQSQQKDKQNNQNSDLKNNPEAQNKTNTEQEPANKTAEQQKSDKELKQWLNKIPDNPAIYLRNQLQYEYWKEQQQ